MPAPTTDWFVAAGAKAGDGSRARPFHDPWVALRAAGPGDVIHIAAGTYYGRYDRSSWIVDAPNLTLRGGYSPDFSRRTPWETPSVFAVWPEYESSRESNLITGATDHTGLVLDGLFFDAAGRNSYGEKPVEGIRAYPNTSGPIAAFNAKNVTIRNCVFANSANAGVELAGDGSHFENNLVVNVIGLGLLTLRNSSGGGEPITVVHNTFAFAHDVGPPCGTGADQAIGVRVGGPAVVQDNLFVSCGNAAISLYRDLDRVSVDRNLFYLTPRDVVKSRVQGSTAEIAEANVEEMEDVGLKSAAGNVVQDPGMTGFRPEWLDAYSRHLLANYVRPPRDAANGVRSSAGLAALTAAELEKEENKGDFAPRLAPADALALRFAASQGYHPVELSAELTGSPRPMTAVYRPIDWSAIDASDPSLANQPVELRAGLGAEQNIGLLADADSTTHLAVRAYRPGSDDGSIYVLARRYTAAQRDFADASRYNNGREVESTVLLRGTYRTDLVPTARQKATLVLDAIVPGPVVEKAPAARPAGRDWFVRAGASGGDGTREKPFRDPFQALDKAEGGDAIHVAGGEYYGKLRSGKWKLLVRNLTLLGGYDAEFTERDPWKHPTRFLLNAEEKAKGVPDGTILASEENSDGLVLDGFVFDGASYNSYTPAGALDVKASPSAPLVSLRGGESAITVRNCVFLNGAAGGVNIACPFGVFENNVVLNVSGGALNVRADGPGPWTIRNNTVLFAGDPTTRAGTGKSSQGTLCLLSGRAAAVVEGNIFAFADNYGVRSSLPQQNVAFNGNVLAACLWIHLTDERYLWADRATWERRAVTDSGYRSMSGNVLELPRLPVDPAFADAALERLFALSSRVSTEEWNGIAAQIGASARPAAVADTASTKPAEPVAAADTSLEGLLASLSSTKDKLKDVEASKTPTAAAGTVPRYCPVFDWSKALLLFRDPAVTGPGAHKLTLPVSFAAVGDKPEVQYTKLTPQGIDGERASLDTKPIELEVTQLRGSSTNSSVYPADLTDSDFDAYAAAAVGETTRTRIAVIVRRDTNASKLLGRAQSTDKLRIRGTARLPRDPGALAIVADSAEAI